MPRRSRHRGPSARAEYQQKAKTLQATLDDEKSTPAQQEIARAQLSALPGQKAYAQQTLDRDNEGVGRSYARSLGSDPQQILEGTEVKVLQDFNGQLDQTVSKALHLHGIFGDIVSDLVEMAIKQALIAPVANTLFPAAGTASGGGGVGGFFGSLVSNIGSAFGIGGAASSLTRFVGGANDALAGSIPSLAATLSGARAGGGPVNAGGTYLVGEKGPELLRMGGQGGNIVPNNALGTMSPNTRANAPSGGTTVLQTIAVDAKGAVMNDQFASQILSKAAQYSNVVGQAAHQAAVRDAGGQVAGIVQRRQTLGS